MFSCHYHSNSSFWILLYQLIKRKDLKGPREKPAIPLCAHLLLLFIFFYKCTGGYNPLSYRITNNNAKITTIKVKKKKQKKQKDKVIIVNYTLLNKCYVSMNICMVIVNFAVRSPIWLSGPIFPLSLFNAEITQRISNEFLI